MGGSIVVTAVDEAGIFGGTDLRGYQTILCINGTSLKNLRENTLAPLIDSFDLLPSGKVTLIVKSRPRSYQIDGVTFKCSTTNNRNERAQVDGEMKRKLNDMPQILKDASVVEDDWWLIHTLISEELMPISVECLQGNEVYTSSMKSYLWDQISNNVEMSLEKAVHMKGVQCGILHNNVTLAAMSVKDQVNAILAKYSISAALAYESFRLPKYPRQVGHNHMTVAVGLNFHSMNYLTAQVVPALASLEPVMVVPTAPVLLD